MGFAVSGTLQAALLALLAVSLAFAWVNASALRRVRAELAGERRRMALVLRATRSGVIDWDATAGRVDYSERLKEMLGFAVHVDLSDRVDFFEWVHEDDRERARAKFLGDLREGREGGSETLHPSIEIRLRRADGGVVWVRGTGLSLRGDDGRAIRYISSVIDISEVKRHEAELSNQVKFIHDLVDSMPLSIAVRDTDGRHTLVNRMWEKYFGGTRENVIGRRARDCLPAEFAQSAEQADQAALALELGATAQPHEIVFGGRRYLQTRTVLGDAQGRITGVLVTGQDTTDRHAMEEALKSQEQRLSLVVRASQSGIIDWPGGTREIFYSGRLKEILGYPPDTDTSGWPDYFDIIHPEDRARVHDTLIDHLRRRTKTAETLHEAIEYRLRRADGSWVWIEGTGLSLRDAEGRATRFLAVISDITQRRAQETALRDQVQLTRDIIDANPNPIFLKDAQARHLEVNAAWEKLTGFKAADVIGRTTAEAFPAGSAAPFVDHDRALLAGESKTRSDLVQSMRKDGLRTFIISKSVLRRADGAIRGLVGSVTDVTQIKRVEEELRASREEALQAAHAKSAFLATMSHEIRTPLNGVLGMAGLLAGTELSEEQREYVDTIRLSGDALLAAINDILDYSKIESGRMQLESEPLEPVRAVEDSLGILGERARAKGLELIAEIDDTVPAWVRGDFGRLRQVLVNLVGNAVKFTERGEVVVRVSVLPVQPGGPAGAEDAMRLEFRVTDTGIGIPRERREALFEAFTQADASTTRKYGGTGLGLAISKRLVEHMGGALRVDSTPGIGSTFSFSVPAQPCEAPAAVPAGMTEIAGRRILVVDDNATNRRILTRQLERWGAVPVAVAGGAEALELLSRDANFDAAVLDYHMPDMDGVMLARELARRAPAIPRLLLSSSMYRRAEEAETGLFAVQLLKPVRQQQLHAALGKALSARRMERAAVRDPAAGAGRLADRLPLRVLVVDDVEVNRRLALALLRGLGYAADAVETGAEAVHRARDYDLLLMDVQMPDLDGLEATRRIRAATGSAGPRIIAMTASALAGDREKCLAAGMDDYLAKPIDPDALRVALEHGADADPIDWSRLDALKAYDDDGTLARGVIDAFLQDAPREQAAMRAALLAEDAAKLAAAAHALKGAAMNVGASAVGKRCAEIEERTTRGTLSDAARLLDLLESRVDRACGALAARMRELPSG